MLVWIVRISWLSWTTCWPSSKTRSACICRNVGSIGNKISKSLYVTSWKRWLFGWLNSKRSVISQLNTILYMHRCCGLVSVSFFRCPVKIFALPLSFAKTKYLCLRWQFNDSLTFGAVVEGIERVSNSTTRFGIIENLYIRDGAIAIAQGQLAEAIMKLYTTILKYLSKVRRYFDRNTASVFPVLPLIPQHPTAL